MVHYRPQEYDVRELSEQDSVCGCTMQWQWDATDDSDSHVASWMLTAIQQYNRIYLPNLL